MALALAHPSQAAIIPGTMPSRHAGTASAAGT